MRHHRRSSDHKPGCDLIVHLAYFSLAFLSSTGPVAKTAEGVRCEAGRDFLSPAEPYISLLPSPSKVSQSNSANKHALGISESHLSPILFSSPVVSYSILCRLHSLCRFPWGRDHPDLHADLREGLEIAYRPIRQAVENVSSRGLYRGEAVVSEKKKSVPCLCSQSAASEHPISQEFCCPLLGDM